MGFAIFSMYMRYFLTPLAAMTWANLNHTLCGIDNDPWRRLFGMHKYYYFWSEAYLMLTSTLALFCNCGVGYLFVPSITNSKPESTPAQMNKKKQ